MDRQALIQQYRALRPHRLPKSCDVALRIDMQKEASIAVVELLDQGADVLGLAMREDKVSDAHGDYPPGAGG